MVSRLSGSPELIVGREGRVCPMDNWFERTASTIPTPSLSFMTIDWIEKLRLDMDGASSERSSITAGRECTRCGEGVLEGVAESEREKDLISGHDCNLCRMSMVGLGHERKKGTSLVASKLFAFGVQSLNWRVSACIYSHGHSSM